MIHRNLLAMFLVLAASSCRIVAAQVERAGEKTVNVKAFGAKGDGVADDTRAIQAAIDHAKAGEKIYFPPGIYDVSNFVVKNRSGLSFTGDGRQSIIRQKSGAARMATIEVPSDIAITNLASPSCLTVPWEETRPPITELSVIHIKVGSVQIYISPIRLSNDYSMRVTNF